MKRLGSVYHIYFLATTIRLLFLYLLLPNRADNWFLNTSTVPTQFRCGCRNRTQRSSTFRIICCKYTKLSHRTTQFQRQQIFHGNTFNLIQIRSVLFLSQTTSKKFPLHEIFDFPLVKYLLEKNY